jgi:hypothetical protein
MPKLRGDQDHTAAPVLDHRWQNGTAHQIRPRDLNREQAIPIRQPDFENASGRIVIRCAVDQDINAASPRVDLRGDRSGLLLVRNIASQRERRFPRRADRSRRFIRPSLDALEYTCTVFPDGVRSIKRMILSFGASEKVKLNKTCPRNAPN